MRLRGSSAWGGIASAAAAGATFAAPWLLVMWATWTSAGLPRLEVITQPMSSTPVRWVPVVAEPPVVLEPPVPIRSPEEPAVPKALAPAAVGSGQYAEPGPAADPEARRALAAAWGARGRVVIGGRGGAPAVARRGACAEPHPSVQEADDGVMEIERGYVDEVTRTLATFMALGYSRPHDEDGVKGWYISGFGCRSAVYHAGFRRHDVLLTVNGKKTRTWPGVYLLYQRLKHQDAFEVELMRRGQPETLRIRVVTR